MARTNDLATLLGTLRGPLDVVNQLLVLEDGRTYGEAMEPFQRAFFQAACATLPDGRPQFRLVYREDVRGGSKTADAAGVMVGHLVSGPKGHRSFFVAGDQDQAELGVDTVRGFMDRNPLLAKVLELKRLALRNKVTGSEARVMSADAPTSYGIRPYVVVFDEVSLQPDGRLFTSMWSAVGKSPYSRLIALSMAGDDFSSIAWKTRELARETPAYFFQTRHGQPMPPWLSAAQIEEMRRTLHPLDFARFFEARWVEPAGSWITLEMFDVAERGQESMHGYEPFRYVAFIDIGLTHDPTVVCAAHREAGDRVVVDTLRTFQGSKGQAVDLAAVEDEVMDLAKRYRLQWVRFEAPQAVASSQRLAKRLSCTVEFRHPTAQTQAQLWGTLSPGCQRADHGLPARTATEGSPELMRQDGSRSGADRGLE